jgi:hypothetical protein
VRVAAVEIHFMFPDAELMEKNVLELITGAQAKRACSLTSTAWLASSSFLSSISLVVAFILKATLGLNLGLPGKFIALPSRNATLLGLPSPAEALPNEHLRSMVVHWKGRAELTGQEGELG